MHRAAVFDFKVGVGEVPLGFSGQNVLELGISDHVPVRWLAGFVFKLPRPNPATNTLAGLHQSEAMFSPSVVSDCVYLKQLQCVLPPNGCTSRSTGNGHVRLLTEMRRKRDTNQSKPHHQDNES